MTTRSKADTPEDARPADLSFAAGEWDLSDQQEPDEKLGKTRAVPEEPERSGMGRGEKPRRPKHHSRR